MLAAIPKSWVPVEKEDVTKDVRKMIVESLTRSAVIAWDARPRTRPAPWPDTVIPDPNVVDAVTSPEANQEKRRRRGILHKRETSSEKGEHIVEIVPDRPVWGDIAHNGWSSPDSVDLPNLQYTSVILELPHLIEARTVSVAPLDPESPTRPALPDIRAVEVLQRPASMGLRDYIGHLVGVGVIPPSFDAAEFLAAYEHARFSSQPLSEEQFRSLMKSFADLLRSIRPLSPAALASLDMSPDESDIDDDVSSTSTPQTSSQVSVRSVSSRSPSEGTIRTMRGLGGLSPAKHTLKAPATPGSQKRNFSKSPSIQSFSQSKRPYLPSNPSSSSLASSGQGSVIRLSPTNGTSDLPYTLYLPGAP